MPTQQALESAAHDLPLDLAVLTDVNLAKTELDRAELFSVADALDHLVSKRDIGALAYAERAQAVAMVEALRDAPSDIKQRVAAATSAIERYEGSLDPGSKQALQADVSTQLVALLHIREKQAALDAAAGRTFVQIARVRAAAIVTRQDAAAMLGLFDTMPARLLDDLRAERTRLAGLAKQVSLPPVSVRSIEQLRDGLAGR